MSSGENGHSSSDISNVSQYFQKIAEGSHNGLAIVSLDSTDIEWFVKPLKNYLSLGGVSL